MSLDRKNSDFLSPDRPLLANQSDIARPYGTESAPIGAFQAKTPEPTPAKSYDQQHDEILTGIGLGGLVK
jgi:hypothetical protein